MQRILRFLILLSATPSTLLAQHRLDTTLQIYLASSWDAALKALPQQLLAGATGLCVESTVIWLQRKPDTPTLDPIAVLKDTVTAHHLATAARPAAVMPACWGRDSTFTPAPLVLHGGVSFSTGPRGGDSIAVLTFQAYRIGPCQRDLPDGSCRFPRLAPEIYLKGFANKGASWPVPVLTEFHPAF